MPDLVDVCSTLTASFGPCQDLFYGLILVPLDEMEAVNKHTHMMVVQGANIEEALDAFVQRRSIWVIDAMGMGEYEVLWPFSGQGSRCFASAFDQLQNHCYRFFIGCLTCTALDRVDTIWDLA